MARKKKRPAEAGSKTERLDRGGLDGVQQGRAGAGRGDEGDLFAVLDALQHMGLVR